MVLLLLCFLGASYKQYKHIVTQLVTLIVDAPIFHQCSMRLPTLHDVRSSPSTWSMKDLPGSHDRIEWSRGRSSKPKCSSVLGSVSQWGMGNNPTCLLSQTQAAENFKTEAAR